MRDTESVDTHTNILCLRGLPSESMSFTSQSLKAIYVKPQWELRSAVSVAFFDIPDI